MGRNHSRSLLTGSLDGVVRLWDVKTGAELRRFQHDDHVNAVAFAPDGAAVLTGSDDRTARLWDVKTGIELRRFQHDDPIYAVAFTPDGLGIYTGSHDGAARLWNRQTGELTWETPRPFWNKNAWTWRILYIWLALVFLVFFLPCLKWFDRGRVVYLRKPNRYSISTKSPAFNAGCRLWTRSKKRRSLFKQGYCPIYGSRFPSTSGWPHRSNPVRADAPS